MLIRSEKPLATSPASIETPIERTASQTVDGPADVRTPSLRDRLGYAAITAAFAAPFTAIATVCPMTHGSGPAGLTGLALEPLAALIGYKAGDWFDRGGTI